MRRVTAVGHAGAVADLIAQLRRDRFHGLEVVDACVAGPSGPRSRACRCWAAWPTWPGWRRHGADTVAVLACPEMDGVTLRGLAWDLEKEGTDLCVAPALMDVAGPRTTIRPVAGLPLLHVDHAELTGAKRAIKSVFDKAGPPLRCWSSSARCCPSSPSPSWSGTAARCCSRQTRIGKDGQPFTVLKFRTMVPDAELRKRTARPGRGRRAAVQGARDPRVTAPGRGCAAGRWTSSRSCSTCCSGEMSLVGPRPPLPWRRPGTATTSAAGWSSSPGMTGLWQVNGRSDLSREDAVRLDLRYVENWSFALDLQILWKTCAAVVKGRGAY